MSSPQSDALEELANLPSFHHPTADPDGSAIAMYYDVTGRNEVHVLDPDSGTLSQWSDGEVPRNARWYLNWANGEVLFHLDEAGNEQNDIWALDADGNSRPLVEQEGQCLIGTVDPDGSFLLFGSNRDGQLNIFRYEFEDETITKLTEYDRAIRGGELSPDGEQIAFATNETDDFDNRDVYVMDADGSDPRNLEIGDIGAEAQPVDWTPDGDAILVTDNTPDLGRVGLYDLETDAVTWYGDGTYEEQAISVMPDGERIVATRMRDAMSIPIVYDIETGEGRELDVPNGVAMFNPVGEVALSDTEVLFGFTTPTRRNELWRYDLDTDEHEVLLGAEYGPFSPDDFASATFERVTSDGVPTTRQAAIEHDPADELEVETLFFDSGHRPSPLLVNPHGGPRGRDSRRFNLYTQTLISLGFSVLQVNYRGSTGRGREFVERLIRDWGGAEQGDVAVATEHVLDRYEWLDENRVAVFGGSYGGYSAYWQLVQYPDLYDVGVAWIGVTDLEDIYENTMPHYRTELMEKYMGTPEENPDLYEERSPVTYAENLSAPLLIAHGVNDRRVPVSQARIFRDALLDAGFGEGADGDFEYVELGKEGHASTDQDQKLRMFRTLEDFLTRRIELPTTATISAD